MRQALVVYDEARVMTESIQELCRKMEGNGWDAIAIPAFEPKVEVQLFDLDTLKPADATEIRELLSRAITLAAGKVLKVWH
jgi:dienelactone hydrolase